MSDDLIEEFWETAVDLLTQISQDTNDALKVNCVEQLREIIRLIDEDLTLEIKPVQLSMSDYPGMNPAYKAYTDKMIILRFDLEISVSGCLEKFPLVEKVYIAHKDYAIPDDWTIVKFYTRARIAPEDNIFIPTDTGTMISISSMRYRLISLREMSGPDTVQSNPIQTNQAILDDLTRVRKAIDPTVSLDSLYDLIIVLEDEFAQTMVSQDQVYQLRNFIMLWLESQIGEYHTAVSIVRLTIIPSAGLEQLGQQELSLKNGCYLIPQLQQIIERDSYCGLCKALVVNTNLITCNNPEYPYITGMHCEFCLILAKNFRPLWIKLRDSGM